jgi:hypothetical protein
MNARRLFFLLAPTVLALLTSSASAASRQTVHACTRESLDAYDKLASQLLPDEMHIPAARLGIVKDTPLNPVVTLAKSSAVTPVEKGDENDDPSCGLAEAIKSCPDVTNTNASIKPPPKSWFFQASLCSEFSRQGIVIYETGYTFERFLIIYRKVEGGWLLIQDAAFNWDAKFSLPQDGKTIRIDDLSNTSHQILKWDGNSFVPWKKWHTVSLWNGRKYVETRLNEKGELPEATPDCSIESVRKATLKIEAQILAGPDLTPEDQRDRAIDATGRPIVTLRCHRFADNAGAALMFSLADWPGAGSETWLYAIKSPASSWRLLQTESDWECVEAIDERGFTTMDDLLQEKHPAECPPSGSCYRHDRFQWNGKEFALEKTWFSGPNRPPSLNPCGDHGDW